MERNRTGMAQAGGVERSSMEAASRMVTARASDLDDAMTCLDQPEAEVDILGSVEVPLVEPSHLFES